MSSSRFTEAKQFVLGHTAFIKVAALTLNPALCYSRTLILATMMDDPYLSGRCYAKLWKYKNESIEAPARKELRTWAKKISTLNINI